MGRLLNFEAIILDAKKAGLQKIDEGGILRFTIKYRATLERMNITLGSERRSERKKEENI